MDDKNSNNKKLWEINEQIYKQKKELDEELKMLEIEKEQLKIDKAEIQKKNERLWEQSKAIHAEKERINELRIEIEARHKEITDSIVYAERLQKAILPQHQEINKHLKNWFILFKPKDIVSGDFYWFEELEDRIIFAAADCTGHGVPGAMVSVICINGLNRSVKELGLTAPGEILDKTREIVIREFEKSDEEVKDGMDISMMSISKTKNANGKFDIEYAGANNPLWIIRKGDLEIDQIKANKQPVGRHQAEVPFDTHQLELAEGDSVYLFSDGYADQFGGEKGKKFKSANFKKLLLSIQDKAMNSQSEDLFHEFENWRGGIEQIDDVCIMGVKL